MKLIMPLFVSAILLMFSAGLGAVEIGEYSNPAKPIRTEPGKIIIITLESNKTTGYAWQLAKALDTNIVDFMSSEYFTHNTDLIGSGGTEVWSFRAMGQGRTKIGFEYVRPWEKDVAPAKFMVFEIDSIEPASEPEANYQ